MFIRAVGFFVISLLIYPQERSFNIRHISVDDGLSQSSVYTIIQDHFGFMWFGTGDGLNKYDGYEFKIYRHNTSNIFSISNNSIRSICEDKTGNIWIGTDKGINKFNPKTNKFYNHFNSAGRTVFNIRSGYDIRNLTVDKGNRLWFTYQNFIYCYNQVTNKLYPYKLFNPGESLINNLVITVNDDIWVSIQNKLFYFDKKLNKFIQFIFDAKYKNENAGYIFEDDGGNICFLNSHNAIVKINRDRNTIEKTAVKIPDRNNYHNNRITGACIFKGGNIMAIIPGRGLFGIDLNSGVLHEINIATGKSNSLDFKSDYCIYRDRSNLFWLGADEGVNIIDLNPPKFKHFIKASSNEKTARGNYVKSLLKDKNGNLWIGTFDYGLNKIEKTSGMFKTFTSKSSAGLKSRSFFSMYEDSSGTLWFGSDGYLYRKEKQADKFDSYRLNGDINSITEYPKGTLWLGTSQGLFSFNVISNNFEMSIESNLPKAFVSNYIWTVNADNKGKLLLGTYGNGLIIFDIKNSSRKVYYTDEENLVTISDNNVKSICPDPAEKNIYWVGTDNGLNRFNLKTSEFKCYYETDGLPNDFIYGILYDAENNLWISTNRGLSKFDRIKNKFRNFSVEDGLQSYEFNTGAYFKDRQGCLYFGGINGYNVFCPDSINYNKVVPNIVLTNIKKSDEDFDAGCDPSEIKEINLNYNRSTITFEFAALEYTNPAKNNYEIKMQGFDHEWIFLKNKRYARYTN